jgi:hypothetical protein
MPKNPEKRAVAQHVLARLKSAFTGAAADQDPARPSGMNQAFRSYLDRQNPGIWEGLPRAVANATI